MTLCQKIKKNVLLLRVWISDPGSGRENQVGTQRSDATLSAALQLLWFRKLICLLLLWWISLCWCVDQQRREALEKGCHTGAFLPERFFSHIAFPRSQRAQKSPFVEAYRPDSGAASLCCLLGCVVNTKLFHNFMSLALRVLHWDASAFISEIMLKKKKKRQRLYNPTVA